ncbi:glycosyltransferase family 4 protein [Roseivirga seohaensis]|uniref:glycosyltransferase family 4 protein n=1 Tax=Roseivirga seohaensis TaxID=1914963 RepID=UPI003BA94A61
MKISFVIPSLPPTYAGGSLRLLRQAQYFSKEHEIKIITCTSGYDKRAEYVFINKGYLKGDNIFSRSVNKLVSFVRIFIHFAFNRPNIVHLVNSTSALSFQSIIASKILRIKIINSCTLYGTDDPLTIKANSLLKYIYFELPNAVVANSPQLYDVCYETISRKGSSYMIPNPVNTDFFLKPNDNNKSGNIELLTVSVVNNRKNVLNLVKAISGILRRFENVNLTVVGPHSRDLEEQSYFEKLKTYIKQNDLTDKIRFVGQVDDVRSYYFDSDIFVFYSTNEGMPNAILESLSCSLPVVCKEIKGVTDFILSEGGGVSAKNDEEFKSSLIGLIESEETRKSIAMDARKNIIDNFSRNKIYKRYLELYREV